MVKVCSWCGASFDTTRRDSKWCSKRCRQTAFRVRRFGDLRAPDIDAVKHVAYADPPYQGTAKKYYQFHGDYRGEVDHGELIARLQRDYQDGWALSTSARALRDLLPLVPSYARVCAWCKPIGVSGNTEGAHNAWEALIVVPARRLRPGVRDFLLAKPAMGGDSDLMGRKPIAFCVWLFQLLGLVRGDVIDDLFPGSGMVGRTWNELERAAKELDGGYWRNFDEQISKLENHSCSRKAL